MQSEEQASFVLTTQLVLPDSHDFPAFGAEEAVDATVAGLVGLDLLPPESGTGLGPGRVLGAAVPEAAL